MKKILAAMLALILAVGMTVSVTAAAGAFVSSPSGNLAPELVKAENESEACEAVIVITAYADRATLGEAGAAAMTAAYNSLAGNADLSAVCAAAGTLAGELGIPATDLAVSDLFDVSYSSCDVHEGHGAFTVTLRPATAENVCAILHYTDGAWELIECTVQDGTVTFVTEELSPFAIVVHNGLPETNHLLSFVIGAGVGLGIGAGVGLLIFFIIILLKKKKKKEEDENENGEAAA